MLEIGDKIKLGTMDGEIINIEGDVITITCEDFIILNGNITRTEQKRQV